MIFHKVDNMPNFDEQVNTELCHKVNNLPNLTLSVTVIPTCHISHILLADHNQMLSTFRKVEMPTTENRNLPSKVMLQEARGHSK